MYRGFPLRDILKRADPGTAETVTVISGDGYRAEFVLADLLDDSEVLLILEGEDLRLIAPGYDGAYWVRQVRRIVVR
jgi:DMSO/TMAO reductase YedYZ molybdopterin-dependent catalytic subunit